MDAAPRQAQDRLAGRLVRHVTNEGSLNESEISAEIASDLVHVLTTCDLAVS
jgi:hypothetical protein